MGCGRSKEKMPVYDPAGRSGIRRIYKFKKLIGNGSFGKVFVAENRLDKSKSARVAIKVMKMKAVSHKLKMIKREINILQSLDHPNIVKYIETRYGKEYVYIVMEHFTGGELLDRIKTLDKFGENEAARIMEKLLRGIAHCHANGVAHRDIKPENIMYATTDPDSEIKLIDFGLSSADSGELSRGGGKVTSSGRIIPKRRQSLVGTPYYVAPEILTGYYNFECDIWSLGVLLYILLSGYYPYGGVTTSDVFDSIQNAELIFTKEKWGNVSEEAIDLIKQMLNRDEKTRISAVKCIDHKWFAKMKMSKMETCLLDPDILDRLKEYQGSSGFQKEVMNVLVKNLNDEEISKLTEQFHIIDRDNTGYITSEELRLVCNDAGNPVPPEQVERIIKNIDYYGNHKINYTEFISATLNAKTFLTDEKLYILFNHFDIDNSGCITEANIKEVLSYSGKNLGDKEIRKMIKEHDTMKNGTLSFEEFKAMMGPLTLHLMDSHLEQMGVNPSKSEGGLNLA